MPHSPIRKPDVLLSVVIAAKDPTGSMLYLCLASFARLSQSVHIEIVISLTGTLPQEVHQFAEAFANFRVVETEPKGVYAAYNAGVKHTEGKYVLFFGIDDIALPAMDTAIEQLAGLSDDVTLFAASCLMQEGGISKPSSWPPSILFRNWCHQGLIYARTYFDDREYEIQYITQADHKLNIDIVSGKGFKYRPSELIIAYFSSGGVSQTRVDLEFRQNLPAIAKRQFGPFYYLAVLAKQRVADMVRGRADSRLSSHSEIG